MIRKRTDAEGGFTLIEVMIAIVVLGTGVVALIVGLGVNSKTSLSNRNQSQAAATLDSAAEYVKSLPWSSAFSTCPTPPAADVDIGAAVAHDPAYTVSYGSIRKVKTTDCSLLVDVTVHVQGNGYDLTVDVLKRPTDAP